MPGRRREEADIATRDGAQARRHVSVRVREETAESFEAVRLSRGYSRPAALEEAMGRWALGRAEESGLRAAGVAEKLDELGELVTGEGQATRDLAKTHREQLGGLIANKVWYATEMVYALLQRAIPNAAKIDREDTRAEAHRVIQEGRRRDAESRNGDGA